MESRYLVVFGGAMIQFTIIGLLFSYGLFIDVLEAEYGWSRTLLSACTSVAFLMMGVLALVAGPLSDRIGPRPVLLVSGLAYGAGYALLSQVSAPWQLVVIFGSLIAMGMSTHDVVTLGTVARWFEARRGIMTAVVKVGTAAGQVAVPPLAAFLILAIGWQNTFLTLGAAAAVVLVLAALRMRRPEAATTAEGVAAAGGTGYAEARRTRPFWTLCAMQFLFLPTLMTVPLHIAVHGTDLGLSKPAAAVLLSVIGASSVAGRLVVGRLLDRIGGRNAYVICFVFLIASLLGLSLVTAHGALYVVMAIYGFGHGGLFVVVSPTVAEYFGMRAHGAIFGTVLFCGTFGGAAGPILAGAVFDTTGSYTVAFVTLMILAMIGLALTLSLPRAAR